jgi:hypothetical protein
LEYDFIVSPGANPESVALTISGAESISMNDAGAIVLKVPGVEVVQQAPVVYQLLKGVKTPVEGHYRLSDGNRVTFEVGLHSPEATLVIDPVLSYSTYVGGTGFDFMCDVCLGPHGDIFFTGTTGSLDLPTTSDAIQPDFNGGNSDVFVGHLRLPDSTLLYCSYIGGSGDEESNG